MGELTKTQRKVMEYILTQVEHARQPPTLREICQYMGYRAVGSAQDLVAALKRKGYLETMDRQSARSIQPTLKARNTLSEEKTGFEWARDVFSVPCLGSVPAGHPLEAIEEQVGTLVLSPSVFGARRPKVDQLFALRATGLSMMGAGILDGDWLVVLADESPVVGSIVVARVEGDATVKRLLKDPDRGYFLNPENPDFTPIYGDETPFEMIGEVLALQRSI